MFCRCRSRLSCFRRRSPNLFPAFLSLDVKNSLAKSYISPASSSRIVHQLLAEVEKERQLELEARKRAGLDTKAIEEEIEEDYLGIEPKIKKWEKAILKESGDASSLYEEPTDSESEEDDRDSMEVMQKQAEAFEKKFNHHKELLNNFVESETLDDAFKWKDEIDRFERKHFYLRHEYRVIGELINRLKIAEGKDKFILQQKINRGLHLVQMREAYDPNNPYNYGVIQDDNTAPDADVENEDEIEEGEENVQQGSYEEFDYIKEKDNVLSAKLDVIDKKLEEKLAQLDHTFGKKGKLLEEEIRDLAEERNELTEKKRQPLYRKGFDVKLINVNRTCKVTEGGQITKYSAILVCGNYQGVIGFAKAKGLTMPSAVRKAHEKCFQNLHYVERYEEHTIAHAIQIKYKRTKVCLWPAPTQTGVIGGNTVQTILAVAGFRNVKSKVIGSKNPYNTVKALFQALNAIETPKDVQEKLGRSVVEKYLL